MKKSTSLILVIGLLSAGLIYFWPIEEIRLAQGLLSVYLVAMLWVLCGTLDRPRWYAISEIANVVGTIVVLSGSIYRPHTYQHLWPVFMLGLLWNTFAAGIWNQFFRDRPALEQAQQSRRAILFVLAGVALVATLFGVDRCTREAHQQTELLKEIAHPDSVKANPTLLGEIKQVDSSVVEAAKLDSAQNDTLIELHSRLLEQDQRTDQSLQRLTAQLKQPLNTTAHATATPPVLVRADAALSGRDRRKLRRAKRIARRDSLRHARVQ